MENTKRFARSSSILGTHDLQAVLAKAEKRKVDANNMTACMCVTISILRYWPSGVCLINLHFTTVSSFPQRIITGFDCTSNRKEIRATSATMSLQGCSCNRVGNVWSHSTGSTRSVERHTRGHTCGSCPKPTKAQTGPDIRHIKGRQTTHSISSYYVIPAVNVCRNSPFASTTHSHSKHSKPTGSSNSPFTQLDSVITYQANSQAVESLVRAKADGIPQASPQPHHSTTLMSKLIISPFPHLSSREELSSQRLWSCMLIAQTLCSYAVSVFLTFLARPICASPLDECPSGPPSRNSSRKSKAFPQLVPSAHRCRTTTAQSSPRTCTPLRPWCTPLRPWSTLRPWLRRRPLRSPQPSSSSRPLGMGTDTMAMVAMAAMAAMVAMVAIAAMAIMAAIGESGGTWGSLLIFTLLDFHIAALSMYHKYVNTICCVAFLFSRKLNSMNSSGSRRNDDYNV